MYIFAYFIYTKNIIQNDHFRAFRPPQVVLSRAWDSSFLTVKKIVSISSLLNIYYFSPQLI